MGKKITVTVEIECEGCGGEQTNELERGEFIDGNVVSTDSPEHHGPVGHTAGSPDVEGDPDEEGI